MVAIIASGGAKKTDEDVDVIWIDAVTSFSYGFQSTMTEHPIESGATVNDHVFTRNPSFQISGVIGGYPVLDASGQTIFADNLVDKGAGVSSGKTGVYSPAPSRTQYAYELLMKMWKYKTRFTLIEELDRFDDCFITSLNIDRTSETADSLFVSMTVVQARLVQSAKTRIYNVSSDYQDRASGTSSGTGSGSSDTKKEVNPDEVFLGNTKQAGGRVLNAYENMIKVMNETQEK